MNILDAFFRWVTKTLNGAEKSFLDFLSVLVPYAVPVIPAYLTFFHTRDMMGFPPNVAYTAAFVVEVLGITSVSTAIRFWRHNKRYKRDDNKAPFNLAIGVYIFYIVIVLAVNVILEIENGSRDGVIILAIALFSLLSVPSGVLISIRTQYGEMLEDIDSKYHRPKQQERLPEPMPSGASRREKHASDYRDRIIQMLDAEFSRSGEVLAPKQITARLKLNHSNNKGFVSNLTKEWRSGKGL